MRSKAHAEPAAAAAGVAGSSNVEDAAPARRFRRFALWCAGVAVLLFGQIAWIAFVLRGPRVLAHSSTPLVIAGQIAFTLALIGIFALIRTTPSAGAIRLSPAASRAWIIGGAAALQLAAVLLLWPGLSEDLVRYRLDGRLWLAGISPYAVRPSDALNSPDFCADAIDRMVTYPRMHTVYPPAAEALFAIGAAAWPSASENAGQLTWRQALAEFSWLDRGSGMRALFALCAVAAAALLVRMLEDASQPSWSAVLFAWSPLLVLETGGMGHVDVAGALAMLTTLYLAHRRRFKAAAAMLAIACGVKPLAIVLLPFLCRDGYRFAPPRTVRPAVGTFVAVSAAIYLPALLYQGGIAGWLETTHTYATSWEANGSIYEVFKSWFGSSGGDGWAMQHAKDQARLFMLCAAAMTGFAAWQFRARLETAGYWIFLAILLTSPVVYPWYLIWALCFVPLLRGGGGRRRGVAGLTALVWSATVALSYRLWDRSPGQPWILSPAELLAEYVPVYAALALELASLVAQQPGAAAAAVERHAPD